MALTICPECGRKVSDKADACPNCGFPVGEHFAKLQLSDDPHRKGDSVPTPKESHISLCKEDDLDTGVSVPKSAVEKEYNNCWFWILAVIVPLLLFASEWLKVGVRIIPTLVVAVVNCVLIVLDDSRLAQSGQNVGTVWKVLGLVLLTPFYIIARAIKTRVIVPMIIFFSIIAIDILGAVGIIPVGQSPARSFELGNYRIDADLYQINIAEGASIVIDDRENLLTETQIDWLVQVMNRLARKI